MLLEEEGRIHHWSEWDENADFWTLLSFASENQLSCYLSSSSQHFHSVFYSAKLFQSNLVLLVMNQLRIDKEPHSGWNCRFKSKPVLARFLLPAMLKYDAFQVLVPCCSWKHPERKSLITSVTQWNCTQNLKHPFFFWGVGYFTKPRRDGKQSE